MSSFTIDDQLDFVEFDRKFMALKATRPHLQCESIMTPTGTVGATLTDFGDLATPEADAKLKVDFEAA